MYWFDTTLLALLGIGAGIGAWCGLVWQIARIVSLGLAVYGSVQFHDAATQLLQESAFQDADPRIVRPIAYVAVFVVIYLILFYTMRLIRDAIRAAELESFDRLLGGLLGATKMALLLGTICLGIASSKHPMTDAIMAKSTLAPAFADGMEVVVMLVPDSYKTRLQDYLSSLRDLTRTLNEQKRTAEKTL